MTLDEKIQALKLFRTSINEYIRKEVIEQEAIICDMNSQIQLYERGIDANGDPIEPEYADLTVQIKLSKSQPTARVTLRDSGDFHASFYIYATNDKFYIDAKDTITEDLTKKYGESIFGLIPEHVSELAQEYIKPMLIKKLQLII